MCCKSEPKLVGYCDSDWVGCIESRKSVTGFCIMLDNSLVSWKVKKQNTVSKSSTEVEYRSMSSALSEMIWLRSLLKELDLRQTN